MSVNLFTDKDLTQISSHGLSIEDVMRQIGNFEKGFEFLPVGSAATVGDGIMRLSEEQVSSYGNLYDRRAAGLNIVKFVPASGAATRMFKELFEFISDAKSNKSVEEVLTNLDSFAFADELKRILGSDRSPKHVIEAMINKEGLNYGAQPKALILFHKYNDGSRTAAEEHLAEGAMYGVSAGKVNIHFTVSEEHLAGFKELLSSVLSEYEGKFGVKYEISYSQQKNSTDTIAVMPDNTPFRDSDGSLLFRPAGHGALLSNLNDIDADLIFIKNIDNIAPDRLKGDTVKYKKALAGVLLELQQQSFELQHKLNADASVDGLLDEAADFIEDKLFYRLPEDFRTRQKFLRFRYLQVLLSRPIRVCGVVKNEGEPGGGPFWVVNPDESRSLQIAESSQIAPEDMELMKRATHFNPVDLVCAVRDFRGDKFNLMEFVDSQTGFISSKSKDGRQLKAQELPGLWNGAMARWNTIFVEVPISTFSPVKAVTDLLRAQHQ